VAARYPACVRTLLLTNCDVDTNSPPKSLADAMEAARKGTLAEVLARHLQDKSSRDRHRGFLRCATQTRQT
jgi:hypothetical protein